MKNEEWKILQTQIRTAVDQIDGILDKTIGAAGLPSGAREELEQCIVILSSISEEINNATMPYIIKTSVQKAREDYLGER